MSAYKEELAEIRFINRYRCPCGTEWNDEWSCTCDDRCPECDTSCAPFESVDMALESPLTLAETQAIRGKLPKIIV